MFFEIRVYNNKGKEIDNSRIDIAFPVIYKDWHETPIIIEEDDKRVKMLMGYEFKPIMIWQDKILLKDK